MGSRFLQELAACELLEILGENRDLTSFLKFYEKFDGHLEYPEIRRRFGSARLAVLAEWYFLQSFDPSGKPLVPRDVVEGCLARANGAYDKPIPAAMVLAALGRTSEAVTLLEGFAREGSDDWAASRVLSLCYLRAGMNRAALDSAERLTHCFAWKAESFDTARHIFASLDDQNRAEDLKRKGDAIFKAEMRPFDELKAYLDALPWPSAPARA